MMHDAQEVQLYAKISDILPTEPNILPAFIEGVIDPDQKILADHGYNCVETFKEDIAKNGMKYAVSINRRGVILDGNCRYWCAIALGWKYIPINLPFFTRKTTKVTPKQLVLPNKDRKDDIKNVLAGLAKVIKKMKENGIQGKNKD